MDTEDLLHRLAVLGAKYHAIQNELSNKYHFNQLRDARINVFSIFLVRLDYIIFLVRLDHLFDEGWWANLMDRNLVSRQMTKQQRDIFIHGFDTFVDSAYITMLSVSLESAFRSFHSSIFSKKTPFSFQGDVWHTFIVITTDILDMLEKLVKSDAILQKQEIIDISYNNLF